MAFTARRSYASAVLGVVILSVCHTRAFWLIQRTYRRYFYTPWKGNPSSEMWFFVQLCSSWQDFSWLKGSLGLSAAAELLVVSVTSSARRRHLSQNSAVDSQINGREKEKLYWADSKRTQFILCNKSFIQSCVWLLWTVFHWVEWASRLDSCRQAATHGWLSILNIDQQAYRLHWVNMFFLFLC